MKLETPAAKSRNPSELSWFIKLYLASQGTFLLDRGQGLRSLRLRLHFSSLVTSRGAKVSTISVANSAARNRRRTAVDLNEVSSHVTRENKSCDEGSKKLHHRKLFGRPEGENVRPTVLEQRLSGASLRSLEHFFLSRSVCVVVNSAFSLFGRTTALETSISAYCSGL